MVAERISEYLWRLTLKGVLGDVDGRVGSSDWGESVLQNFVSGVERCW